ncbi:MAG TPA: GNAT family protein [Coleofasciculaceae cyanobacterium]|jgi:ribosomal-protein-alanine N-acetyltransferase
MNTNNLFTKFPVLETENLMLRETTLSDASAIFQIFASEAVTKYHDIETVTNMEQAKFLIYRRAERFKNKQGIRWGIARKDDNVIIGSCGYSIRNCFQAEIGYELIETYWRQGIMTEALRAVIRWGFQNLEFNRIEGMVMVENIASINLLKKLGFLEEGLLREYGIWKGQFHDLKIFSLLKRDYMTTEIHEGVDEQRYSSK